MWIIQQDEQLKAVVNLENRPQMTEGMAKGPDDMSSERMSVMKPGGARVW